MSTCLEVRSFSQQLFDRLLMIGQPVAIADLSRVDTAHEVEIAPRQFTPKHRTESLNVVPFVPLSPEDT